MTVPIERTNAVVFTRNLLCDLLDPKITPRVPKSIRMRAYSALRHYPTQFDMDVISSREDNEPEIIKIKIFGRGFS